MKSKTNDLFIKSDSKNHASPINKLSMEERIPTIPIMFNRIFRINKSTLTSQGKCWHVDHFPIKTSCCPQCKHGRVKFYDHYFRKALYHSSGQTRLMKIKSKRYRCLKCNFLFRQSIEGLEDKNEVIKDGEA